MTCDHSHDLGDIALHGRATAWTPQSYIQKVPRNHPGASSDVQNDYDEMLTFLSRLKILLRARKTM
jgi:hypothetical protein